MWATEGRPRERESCGKEPEVYIRSTKKQGDTSEMGSGKPEIGGGGALVTDFDGPTDNRVCCGASSGLSAYRVTTSGRIRPPAERPATLPSLPVPEHHKTSCGKYRRPYLQPSQPSTAKTMMLLSSTPAFNTRIMTKYSSERLNRHTDSQDPNREEHDPFVCFQSASRIAAPATTASHLRCGFSPTR